MLQNNRLLIDACNLVSDRFQTLDPLLDLHPDEELSNHMSRSVNSNVVCVLSGLQVYFVPLDFLKKFAVQLE